MHSLERCGLTGGSYQGCHRETAKPHTVHWLLSAAVFFTNDTARSSLKSIKKDYRALGVTVRDSEAHVVFLSVLPVEGRGFERASQIWQVNK